MRSLLYFLLGFFLVFALALSADAADGFRFFYSADLTILGQVYAAPGPPSFNSTTNQWDGPPPYALTPPDTGYKNATVAAAYCSGAGVWSNLSIYPNSRYFGGVSFEGTMLPYDQTRSLTTAALHSKYGNTCPPPPCDPPNALNPAGECVNCPSGVFLVTGYCVPECDYSHPYIPGELYNPPEGTGTCVMPDCGTGQVQNTEGRCVSNCPEGQKIDTVTGTCVSDCPYGTHEVDGECINDCLPGFYKDAETGSCVEERGCLPGEEFIQGICVNKCLPGETRNADGGCDPAPVNCPFGQHEENGVCVASKVNCPPGMTFDSSLNTCTQDAIEVVAEREVVDNQDGTYTETRTTTVTTTNGTTTEQGASGGTISGTVTTTTTGTIPAAGPSGTGDGFLPGQSTTTTNFSPPEINKYESPEHILNWDGWNSQKKRFAEEGPLMILKKLQGLVESFDVEPQTPEFTFIVGGHSFNVDLHAFDELAQATRFLLGCFMTIGAVTFGYRIFGLI